MLGFLVVMCLENCLVLVWMKSSCVWLSSCVVGFCLQLGFRQNEVSSVVLVRLWYRCSVCMCCDMFSVVLVCMMNLLWQLQNWLKKLVLVVMLEQLIRWFGLWLVLWFFSMKRQVFLLLVLFGLVKVCSEVLMCWCSLVLLLGSELMVLVLVVVMWCRFVRLVVVMGCSSSEFMIGFLLGCCCVR